jgi:hypothetical protein
MNHYHTYLGKIRNEDENCIQQTLSLIIQSGSRPRVYSIYQRFRLFFLHEEVGSIHNRLFCTVHKVIALFEILVKEKGYYSPNHSFHYPKWRNCLKGFAFEGIKIDWPLVLSTWLKYVAIQQNSTYPTAGNPNRQFARSAWPFEEICLEFYKTKLPWNYWLSDQVQYSVMASRTSNQAWLKVLDAGI